MHQWSIGKIPGMWMGRINSTKCGKELPSLHLKIEWQTGRLQECFFSFHVRVVVVIELENNIGETFEVRIDCAVKCQFDIASIESALLWIVIADLDSIEIAGAGISQREQPIERDVHVILPATNGDRC